MKKIVTERRILNGVCERGKINAAESKVMKRTSISRALRCADIVLHVETLE